MKNSGTVRVLFVCLGNICRSPTAHGVFEALVQRQGLSRRIEVDSCGTGDWHVGESPDGRASAEARKRGYELGHLRARQVCMADFQHFDYILAMDRQNLQDLQRMAAADYCGQLRLFLDYADGDSTAEVPDPYYGGDTGFARVLDLVEDASTGLLRDITGADAN